MIQIDTHNEYEIYQTSRADERFFCEMGRFFCDRQIIKELEGPIFDDDSYTWLVAKLDGIIVGFSGYRIDGKGGHFALTYVMPEHRRKGLYRKMFGIKYRLCASRDVQSVDGVANPLSKAVFDEAGWQVSRVAGKWTHYRKEVSL